MNEPNDKNRENTLPQDPMNLVPADEYKAMINAMLEDEVSGRAEYISFENIKKRFQKK